ncbi:MAG: SDR family oxidoreductase [Calditrichaceae bacterium]|nr:SDR family oxidoreductase [Calditrichaceae bacterium]MBN2710424.1 SDR family oxidoreductase [Calditrichaceae bacterium]RQV93638.1 MAG: SDR family oxidoreductase [Calditrichota bacterium]
MEFGLRDRVAVVLAASRGFGFAAAQALAKEKCRVAICSRSKSSIDNAGKKIKSETGVMVIAQSVNVQNKNELAGFFHNVQEKWGKIDILVSNAGGPPVKNFEDTIEEEWAEWFETTFMSVVRSIQLVLPQMKLQKWGRIINIASITVKSPLSGLTYSNALRLGVIGLAKSLANELGPFGITVNNVAPGYHLTDGLERIIRKKIENGLQRDEIISQWTDAIPVRRLGAPEDLAGLIAFLASQQAGYINGATIQVDGGMYSGSL